MKKLISRSARKYLRLEKGRIRRTVSDVAAREEKIGQLLLRVTHRSGKPTRAKR